MLAAPAAASHPACPEWSDGLAAYPYGFQGVEYNLPECRLAARGTPDSGTHALVPQRINMRRPLGFLEPNPDAGGRVRWPLVDSFGRPLAVLERHADRWETTDPDTGTVIYRDFTLSRRQLTVQGRGCMADDALESEHALVAFNALDRRTLPPGATIVPFQVRAFLPRAALPAANEAGAPIALEVDLFAAGCGPPAAAAAAAEEVEDPNFDSDLEQFYGQDGIARTYATYNVKHKYANARYFLIDSTGVGGGGIVRGGGAGRRPGAARGRLRLLRPQPLALAPRPGDHLALLGGQLASPLVAWPERCQPSFRRPASSASDPNGARVSRSGSVRRTSPTCGCGPPLLIVDMVFMEGL